MSMNCCNKAGSIIDAKCIYGDGRFVMGNLPCCLPDLFTIRFRAPKNYKTGEVVVVNNKELPVRTPGMVAAATDIFKTGAVVHCDIDMERELAFFWQSNSNSGGSEHYTGRRLLATATTYYLRKDGNDSNDGLSEETAFETWDRMWQELMSIDGSGNTLTINLGVGTWANNFAFDGRHCIGFESITLIGQGNKTIISPNGGTGVDARYGGVCVYVQDVTISGAVTGLSGSDGGVLEILGTVTLSNIVIGIHAQRSGFVTLGADSTVIFNKNPSSKAFLRTIYGGTIYTSSGSSILLTGTNAGTEFIYVSWNSQIKVSTNSTISGTFTGKKYHVTSGGAFYNGAKTTPGTIAGSVSSNGVVL